MFNWICEFFVRRYVPRDKDVQLAEALFNWKFKS